MSVGKKGRLCLACWPKVRLYRNKTWPNKDDYVIRPGRNDVRMVRWACNVTPEVKISAMERRGRPQSDESIQNRKLE